MRENYDNNIKSSLDDIDVPENISKYISKGVKKRKYQNGASMVCKCLIALMIVTVTLGNLSPTIAKEIKKVPGVGSVFKYLHWNKSMDVLEEEGLINNSIVKCKNRGVEFLVTNVVSDEDDIVIYYEIRSKKDYYVIAKMSIFNEDNESLVHVASILDYGIDKTIENGTYTVKGYIKESITRRDKGAFVGVDKIKLSVDLVPLKDRDKEIVGRGSEQRTPRTYKWNVALNIEAVDYDIKSQEINKTIYNDDKFKIDLIDIEISPLKAVYEIDYLVKMDKEEYAQDEGISIRFDVNDGEDKYEWEGSEGMPYTKGLYIHTESPYFSKSEKLFVDNLSITYYEELEDKLVIDLKEGTICDAYKDKIEIVSIAKDKKNNYNTYVVTISKDENYAFEESGNNGLLECTESFAQKIKIYLMDKDDVGKAEFRVLIRRTIKKNKLNIRIK